MESPSSAQKGLEVMQVEIGEVEGQRYMASILTVVADRLM